MYFRTLDHPPHPAYSLAKFNPSFLA